MVKASDPIITSVIFGGKNPDEIFIGNVLGTNTPYFSAPITGQPPTWWETSIC